MEHKFRAWDKKNNRMVDALWRMKIDMHGNIIWLVDKYDGNLRLIEREETDGNDRFILMQFTGLKIHEKDSYGGDILRVKWITGYDDNDNPIYEMKDLVIEYRDTAFMVEWNWFSPGCDYINLGYVSDWLDNIFFVDEGEFEGLEYEIVGNIH